jgi:16S rRNA processing protein RimM
MAQKLILVGKIGAAHGLKGEVKLASFTEDPLAIADYGPLHVEGSGQQLVIAALRKSKSQVIARLEGVNSRSAAERLKGCKLYVRRERLPGLAADSYYHTDLLGLEVRSAGRRLGTVAQVLNFGAGDLLELAPAEDGETILVPFAGAKVDLEAGVIEVDLAEGFLEREQRRQTNS